MFPDTIFALSSGRLPSAVAVVRLSGSACRFVCETLCGEVPQKRQARLRRLLSKAGHVLDTGLIIWFPAPESFTGEDCLELHLHGGIAVVKAILEELGTFPDVRQAEPGEFTRRAFINGKLDLVQAEALSDLIAAETEAQRRFAVSDSQRQLSELYSSWRQRLLALRAAVEAELDFSDEADVPEDFSRTVTTDLAELAAEMAGHCDGYRRAEIIRDGFDIVLAGAPNAGKSSLINALAERDVAIVSPEPGTTRDLIEVNLDLDGYKVRVTDTAGLREPTHAVERIGIDRAIDRMSQADLVLHLIDMSACGPAEVPVGKDVIRVGTKADLVESPQRDVFDISVSSTRGDGLSDLLSLLANRVEQSLGTSEDILPTQLRHVRLVKEAQRHLAEAAEILHSSELLAEKLRSASNSLGRITGHIGVEDILDSIFSQFCIGK